jgi:hypothetical protein
LSSPEAGTQRHHLARPVYIVLFGLFSIIFGAVLTFATLALASTADLTQTSPLWPLVALTSIGYVACGLGFFQGKSWAWTASVLLYGASFAGSVAQAFLRLFVWGIFIEPVVLVYLLIPRVRAYFFHSPELAPATRETEIPLSLDSQPMASRSRTSPHTGRRTSTILTGLLMLAIASVVPAVAVSVHSVSVTGVTLNIVYAGNSTLPWFGYSPQTVSGAMFTWGRGQMGFRFSLTNLGLFQSHSINSISIKTQGFALYAPSTPISVPDLALVNLSMRLQAPDYNYNGPVNIEVQTS